MKFKEWADVLNVYKGSFKRINKDIFKSENLRWIGWPLGIALSSTLILCLATIFGSNIPAIKLGVSIALIPWAITLYITRMKMLRTLYPRQFHEHAIDRQSFWDRDNILYYALFLEDVRQARYTATKLRELAKYAALVGKPAKPPIAQNIVFAFLVGLSVSLSVELIKKTYIFVSGDGWVFLVISGASLFICQLVRDGFHSKAYERARVKRFLELAAHDLTQIA